ncbi:hypothetical protein [Corynebacterium pacaense]|uniref:hypothetical protein n=1 Tax=Corynebacterium pacaense TaxID=1816684 RepID=UPI0009BAC0AC|nr:hypothetical protein [Corynebacterium pacaense]
MIKLTDTNGRVFIGPDTATIISRHHGSTARYIDCNAPHRGLIGLIVRRSHTIGQAPRVVSRVASLEVI